MVRNTPSIQTAVYGAVFFDLGLLEKCFIILGHCSCSDDDEKEAQMHKKLDCGYSKLIVVTWGTESTIIMAQIEISTIKK